jgi:hypothetical protein
MDKTERRAKRKREAYPLVREVESLPDDALFKYEYIIPGEIMARRDISLLEKMVFSAHSVYVSTDWCDPGGNPLPLTGEWDEILGVFGIPYDEAAKWAMDELVKSGFWTKIPDPKEGLIEVLVSELPDKNKTR